MFNPSSFGMTTQQAQGYVRRKIGHVALVAAWLVVLGVWAWVAL